MSKCGKKAPEFGTCTHILCLLYIAVLEIKVLNHAPTGCMALKNHVLSIARMGPRALKNRWGPQIICLGGPTGPWPGKLWQMTEMKYGYYMQYRILLHYLLTNLIVFYQFSFFSHYWT